MKAIFSESELVEALLGSSDLLYFTMVLPSKFELDSVIGLDCNRG
jgi:hypothetical protein